MKLSIFLFLFFMLFKVDLHGQALIKNREGISYKILTKDTLMS